MRQLAGAITIAVVASIITLMLVDNDVNAQSTPFSIRYTEPSEQDAWVAGTRRGGEQRLGYENDEKPLVEADNSVCFLTKVEIEGQDSLDDKTGCYIALDDFTNIWTVNAEKAEGSNASVACNARCITWGPGDE